MGMSAGEWLMFIEIGMLIQLWVAPFPGFVSWTLQEGKNDLSGKHVCIHPFYFWL